MSFWVYYARTDLIVSIDDEEMVTSFAQNNSRDIYFEAELVSPSSRYQRIRELESRGILGPEACPDPNYWHWPVVHKDLLPVEFLVDFEMFGEIRYY